MRKLNLDDIRFVLSKLGNITLFQYLTDDEKWELLKICEIYEYEPDEKIITQGETGDCFYAILAGKVNVTIKESTSGNEIFLSVIGEGEFFGEAGIFNNAKRTANVSAAVTSEVICINRSDLFDFISQHTAAGVKILMIFVSSLLKKLNDSNKELSFERRNVLDQSAIDQFLQNLSNK